MDQKLFERTGDLLSTLWKYRKVDARKMTPEQQLKLGKKLHYVTNKWKKELQNNEG